MNYVEAAETLLSKNTLLTFFLALIALAVLLILAANGIKAFKELFGKKTRTLETHCREAEERFKAGEKPPRCVSACKEMNAVHATSSLIQYS